MTEHTFDSVAFRLQFPYFASELKYPTEQLAGYFSLATCYIFPCDWEGLNGTCLQMALNLMTAHLGFSDDMIKKGNTSVGAVTGATIDKVSVSMAAPPVTDGWNAWLSTTPFGMRLWALLRVKSRGVKMLGALPERDAFRNVYGVHGGGRRWLR